MAHGRRKVAGAAAIALTAWLGAAAGLDRYGQRTPTGTYDAIVVAGCRVDPGGSPSLALKRRTERAVALWRAGVAPRVVFTGGVGTYPPSEAQAAATYATSLGLPASAAILEDRSTSTEENARFAAALLPPTARIVVVTDTYHVYRAERVFRRSFTVVAGTGTVACLEVRVKGAFREVAAVGLYFVEGRL